MPHASLLLFSLSPFKSSVHVPPLLRQFSTLSLRSAWMSDSTEILCRPTLYSFCLAYLGYETVVVNAVIEFMFTVCVIRAISAYPTSPRCK